MMHGIFCLECDWWEIKEQTSVLPILDLLHRGQKDPYIHRHIATREEFEHYVYKWTLKGLARYPILYLGFHGRQGTFWLGDSRKRMLICRGIRQTLAA